MTNQSSTQRAEFNPDPAAKPYSVTLWGSNPDLTDNDDCWTGDEFATREEAITCYRSICMWPTDGHLPKVCGYDWEYVMIDGPDLHEVSANSDQLTQRRHRQERTRSDADWSREQAMQAGMAFGCEGYNDAMDSPAPVSGRYREPPLVLAVRARGEYPDLGQVRHGAQGDPATAGKWGS